MDAAREPWFYRIKSASRLLIDACGGIEAAAEVAMVGKSTMGRWRTAGEPDIMSLPAVLALEDFAGKPLITTAMAELSGRRLSDPEEGSVGRVAALNARLAMAHAEALAVGAQALADGKLTPTEADQLEAARRKMDLASIDLGHALAAARAGRAS